MLQADTQAAASLARLVLPPPHPRRTALPGLWPGPLWSGQRHDRQADARRRHPGAVSARRLGGVGGRPAAGGCWRHTRTHIEQVLGRVPPLKLWKPPRPLANPCAPGINTGTMRRPSKWRCCRCSARSCTRAWPAPGRSRTARERAGCRPACQWTCRCRGSALFPAGSLVIAPAGDPTAATCCPQMNPGVTRACSHASRGAWAHGCHSTWLVAITNGDRQRSPRSVSAFEAAEPQLLTRADCAHKFGTQASGQSRLDGQAAALSLFAVTGA